MADETKSENPSPKNNSPTVPILVVLVIILALLCGSLAWLLAQPNQEADSQLAGLSSRISSLEEERDDALAQAKAANAALEDFKKEYEVLKAEFANLKKENEELSKAASMTKAELKRIRESAKEAEKAKDALRRKLGNLEAEVTREKAGLKIKLANKIFFASGSAQLKKEGKDALKQLAESLTGKQKQSIWVIGHTDNVPMRRGGVISSNRGLSAARAVAAVDYLIELGISPERLAAIGMGEGQPVSDNANDEGKAKNRRIEIILPDSGELPF